MPRFMRSIWSKGAANDTATDFVSDVENSAANEEQERRREADYVRELQARLKMDTGGAANADADPAVTNIFSPVRVTNAK